VVNFGLTGQAEARLQYLSQAHHLSRVQVVEQALAMFMQLDAETR